MRLLFVALERLRLAARYIGQLTRVPVEASLNRLHPERVSARGIVRQIGGESASQLIQRLVHRSPRMGSRLLIAFQHYRRQ